MTEKPENLTDEELENNAHARHALFALRHLRGTARRTYIKLIEAEKYEFERLVKMHSSYEILVARSRAEDVDKGAPEKAQ